MHRIVAAIRESIVGFVIAFGVFLAFFGYAFLAPATYRAVSAVLVELPKDAKPLPPSEGERRLSEAVLTPASLQDLARPRSISGSPQALREAAQVSTNDGRVFQLTFNHRTAAGAQSMADALARRAVEEAPRVLVPRPSAATAGRPQPRLGPLTARVLTKAPLPAAPISPKRVRLILFGAFVACVTIALFVAIALLRARQRVLAKPRAASAVQGPSPSVTQRLEVVQVPDAGPIPRAPMLSFESVRESVSTRAVPVVNPDPPEQSDANEQTTAPPPAEVAQRNPDRAPETQRIAHSEIPPPPEEPAPANKRQRRFASDIPTLIGDSSSNVMREAAAAIRAADRKRSELSNSAPPPAASVAPEPPVEEAVYSPPSRPRRRRAGDGGTLLVGSFAAPDARETRGARSNRAPLVAETTYRYSSAPPPAAGPAPEPEPERLAPNVLRAPPGWSPDSSLVLSLHLSLR
ncbi:MAG TPA: hypothetical protein VK524_18515 [Polyangiaceae bacterium]|nr:hypothetical protein [Polyangiaceae bacterium]